MSKKEPLKPKPEARSAKKPWDPPRIKTGKLFEMNSLACAKASSSICIRAGKNTS